MWKKVRHISAKAYLDVLLGGPGWNSTNIDGTADVPGDVARLSSVLQHGESINY